MLHWLLARLKPSGVQVLDEGGETPVDKALRLDSALPHPSRMNLRPNLSAVPMSWRKARLAVV
jgi:hypothetical protein